MTTGTQALIAELRHRAGKAGGDAVLAAAADRLAGLMAKVAEQSAAVERQSEALRVARNLLARAEQLALYEAPTLADDIAAWRIPNGGGK